MKIATKILQGKLMYENVKQKSTMNPPQQQHYDQVKLFSVFEHIACFLEIRPMFMQMRNISVKDKMSFR